MPCYIVSYDLSRPGRNYDSLISRIKDYGTCAPITKSTWAIVTEDTADDVGEYLAAVIDSNDKLFVVRSGGEGVWWSLPQDITNWLEKHL